MAHSCTLQESCRVFVQVLQPTAHWINARGFGKGLDHHAKAPPTSHATSCLVLAWDNIMCTLSSYVALAYDDDTLQGVLWGGLLREAAASASLGCCAALALSP